MGDTVIAAMGGILTVICSILAVVVTLQKIGLMAGRERNPHLTKTLEKVSAAQSFFLTTPNSDQMKNATAREFKLILAEPIMGDPVLNAI